MKNNNILYLVLSLIIITSCSNDKSDQNDSQAKRPVKYIEVNANNTEGLHSFTGLAKARQIAHLSFKVGGTVKNIPVKMGQLIQKGQLLASIDATDYQVSYTQSLANVKSSKAQIESAKAQLESARANYIASESNYKRFEKLYETNSISISDFEQAKSSFLGAEASFNAAKTQVEAAQAGQQSSNSMAKSASNQINYTKLKAPFAGIITKINVEPNEIVGQGNPVVEINSISNPDIEIGVSENIISEIKNGQKVKIEFNSIHGQKFNGEVYEIGYSSKGTTYPVTIRLTDNDERIRPGMPASAMFAFDDHHSSKNALVVPPSSVGEDSKGNFVYLINGTENNYSCKKQSIKIGELTDAGFEVLSGLTTGDKVASAGLNVLREGMQVSLYQKK